VSYYQQHVFFCTNQKADGKKCCSEANSEQAAQTLKAYLIDKQHFGPGKIRVSTSGCLGRCKKGPCVVVYPQGNWLRFSDEQSLHEIGDLLISGKIEDFSEIIEVD
jgi:(2Fe-2S) ferredoxin